MIGAAGGASVEEALVAYEGVTDADGNVGGTTLKCSAIGSASSYPNFDGNQIMLTSGAYEGQARNINGATNGDVPGTITVAKAFDGKVLSNTSFIITGIRTGSADVTAIQADLGDFSAQSNLKSLLAVLGSGWNTANKNMYTLLVTDYLAHATHGLVKIEEYVDCLPVTLNNITAANVRQSVCLTGDAANTIGKILYELYNTRLTATKSGYLNASISAIPTTMVGTNNAALAATALTDATWTDAKAVFLDEDISAPKTLTVAERTAIRKSVCLTGDTASSIGKILYDLNARATAVRLAHLNADIDSRSSHTAANVRAQTCLTGDAADSIGKILFDLNAWWKDGGRLDLLIDAISTNLEGQEITGDTGSIAAATPTDCSAIIGQSGKRSILQGGIIRGVQTLNAGKKVTVRVYKYNGAGWDLVDKYDVTKDSELEVNIGYAAHNDYMRISVEHDDSVSRTFTYAFVIQDMEQ